MYVFRLGIISTLLSETFVNGFTTGAAIHVLVSQLADLLGVKLPKRKGYFKVVYVRKKIIQEKLIESMRINKWPQVGCRIEL